MPSAEITPVPGSSPEQVVPAKAGIQFVHLRGCENIADHAKTRHPGAGRDPCGALVANKINEMNDLDSGLRRNDETLEVQRIFSQTLTDFLGDRCNSWIPAFAGMTGSGVVRNTFTASGRN